MNKTPAQFQSRTPAYKHTHMRHERSNPQAKTCACGRPAVVWNNGFVCERCRELEKSQYVPESSGRGRSYADIVYTVNLTPD